MRAMEDVLERGYAACGGVTRLAEAIGTSVQTVSNWRLRGVPIQMCAAVEIATQGAVTRRDMRPDDWHRIWPELVTDEHPAPAEAKA